MRKLQSNNELCCVSRRGGTPVYRASAFSLAELVVSLGILVLMFALVGQVFNFTVQSTGQATAIVEVNQQLRALEQTLRDDLAFVEQGRSVMVIQGNSVNAYWTPDNKEADDDGNPATGYPMKADAEREYIKGDKPAPAPPRADMLMFFSARKATSYTDSAVTADLQQVVYGHAELGEYVANRSSDGGGTTYTFEGIVSTQKGKTDQPMFPVDQSGYPSPTKTCLVPASQWHLARRSVLIAPTYQPRVDPPGVDITTNPVAELDDPRLLDGSTDIIAHFILPSQPSTFRCSGDCPPFNFDEDVLRPATNNEFTAQEAPVFFAWQLPRIFAHGVKPYGRSRLDVTPPPALATRLGHYLLPNCASFKVEWTLDPRSSLVAGRLDGMTEVLWFDPGFVDEKNKFNPAPDEDDPLNALEDAITAAKQQNRAALARNLESLLDDRTEHLDGTNYMMQARFRSNQMDANFFPPMGSDGRANTVAFVANRRDQSTNEFELVPDDIFPSALRITVDVYDREGRLDRPIRHVMVIPVGR